MIRAFLAMTAVALLTSCAAPLPAVTWLRLPVLPPDGILTSGAMPVAARQEVWQLMAPVVLPGHLDHDALLVPHDGGGTLRAQTSLRWAEPLRDVVPRLLRTDLVRMFGAEVWSGTLPPGVAPTRHLRVELLAFDVLAQRRGVAVHAQFSIADADGRRAPRTGQAAFEVVAADTSPDALVDAHRAALARLAVQVAAVAAGG